MKFNNIFRLFTNSGVIDITINKLYLCYCISSPLCFNVANIFKCFFMF